MHAHVKGYLNLAYTAAQNNRFCKHESKETVLAESPSNAACQTDIWSLFRATCTATPDAPFLILASGTVITYAQAAARSAQIA
ncbi:MAG: hypothetical protein ACOVKV_04925, partial [Novosphingobium sp.]